MPKGDATKADIPRLQLDFEEACTATGVPVSTMELLERRGNGPLFFKLGHRKFTTPELIQEWQQKQIRLAREEAEADDIAKRGCGVRNTDSEVLNWTPDQQRRKAECEAGKTVLANMRGDAALLAWAAAHGKLVWVDRKSKWGNPFELPKDVDRKTVIESYRIYLNLKSSLQNSIGELRGKVL